MVLKIRCILLNFANYLLYYTCKKVTYEYNCWRREDESVYIFSKGGFTNGSSGTRAWGGSADNAGRSIQVNNSNVPVDEHWEKTCTKFRNAIKGWNLSRCRQKIKCKEYDEIEIAGIFDCGFLCTARLLFMISVIDQILIVTAK